MQNKFDRRKFLKKIFYALPVFKFEKIETYLNVSRHKGAVIFVDYKNGDDRNNGLNKDEPRKTVPSRLHPGSVIRFKGGVHYAEEIRVTADGGLNNPIIYDGNSANDFGHGRAIISNWIYFKNWKKDYYLRGVKYWSHNFERMKNFDEKIFYDQYNNNILISQIPFPRDNFFLHNTSEYFVADKVVSDKEFSYIYAKDVLEEMKIYNNLSMFVRVHVRGNWVSTHRILSYDHKAKCIKVENKRPFDKEGQSKAIRFHKSRRFAIINHPKGLERPGSYLVLEKEKRILLQPALNPDQQKPLVKLAGWHRGISIRADNIHINGFLFEGISGPAAISAVKSKGISKNITLTNNLIRKCDNIRSAILIIKGSYCEIKNNYIHHNINGRGIICTGKNINIKKNKVKFMRKTCIYLDNCVDCSVIGNEVGPPVGIHANGISLYKNNIGTKVYFNFIVYPENWGIGLTVQNAEMLTIAFNTIFVGAHRGASHWPNTGRDKPDAGGHVWANNLILTTSSKRSWSIHSDGMAGSTIVNNIVDGINFGMSDSLLMRARNAMTRHADGVGLDARGRRQVGDFVTYEALVFRNRDGGDFRPSVLGRSVLADGHPVVIEGVHIDWIGRYRMDGSEAWDWDA